MYGGAIKILFEAAPLTIQIHVYSNSINMSFNSISGISSIDSKEGGRLIKKWRVSNEPSMSDHRIITFEIEGKGDTIAARRNTRRTNWENYRTDLKTNLDELEETKAPRTNRDLCLLCLKMNCD